MSTPTMAEPLLTIPDVAERLRVSPTTVLGWLQSGQLRGYRPGGTKIGWRVSETDLQAFLDSTANRPPAEEQ